MNQENNSSFMPISSLTLYSSKPIRPGIDVSQLDSLTISSPKNSPSTPLLDKIQPVPDFISGLKIFLGQLFPKLTTLTLIGIEVDTELLTSFRKLPPKCLIIGGCYLPSPDLSGFNTIEELRLAPTNIAGAYIMPRSLRSLHLMFSKNTAGHYGEELSTFPTLIHARDCLSLKVV